MVVSPGCNAVHCKASGEPMSLTSEMSGPWRGTRPSAAALLAVDGDEVPRRSSCPPTHRRLRIGSDCRVDALDVRSCTSGPTLVTPQAICSLWPMTMAGRPERWSRWRGSCRPGFRPGTRSTGWRCPGAGRRPAAAGHLFPCAPAMTQSLLPDLRPPRKNPSRCGGRSEQRRAAPGSICTPARMSMPSADSSASSCAVRSGPSACASCWRNNPCRVAAQIPRHHLLPDQRVGCHGSGETPSKMNSGGSVCPSLSHWFTPSA